MRHRRALVIGGSVGGLLAAHHLRATGWDATIFERGAGDLADRGACIGTQPALFDVMKGIGIPLDASVGVPVDARICLDAGGKVAHRVETRSITSAWDRVYRPLREAFADEHYHKGRKLEAIEQSDASVTAIFADGARETGDLLVAADGGQSTARSLLAPRVAPKYAGYVAWRGVIEERDLTEAEHRLLFGRMTFCLPRGELLLALGMPGRDAHPRPGERRYYWIWFRPADEESALRDIFRDVEGHFHGTSMAPTLLRPDIIDNLKASAGTLAPQLAAIVRRTARPFPSAIFDLEQDQIVFGRVALLGDAAFIARPHVASGVTKAALDAKALGGALLADDDIDMALQRYQRERIDYGAGVVARARHLGSHLEATAIGNAEAPFQRPEVVLKEYGTAGRIG